MTFAEKHSWLGSSQDPRKISLTIKALAVALIPLIVAGGRSAGYEITESDLVQLIEQVTVIVSAFGFVVGIIRKYIK